MRPDKLYLTDMVDAADAIQGFLQSSEQADFLGSDMLQAAVLQKLLIIGEAASKLSQGLKERHADVPWSRIVAFRNIAVHAYFAVDWTIVWTAATEEAPYLKQTIARILAGEDDVT